MLVVVQNGSLRMNSGQIAALTGGEVGNKSPLSVEMSVYITSFGTQLLISSQRKIRHIHGYRCGSLRSRVLRYRYYDGI